MLEVSSEGVKELEKENVLAGELAKGGFKKKDQPKVEQSSPVGNVATTNETEPPKMVK